MILTDCNQVKSNHPHAHTDQLLAVPSRHITYNLVTFLAGQTIMEGELSKSIERQKSKLARWAVLKNDALLVYKDKLQSRSFPEKTVQCIPINEISKIIMKEIFPPGYTSKMKSMHPTHYELEITLKDTQTGIANRIKALNTEVSNQTIQQ